MERKNFGKVTFEEEAVAIKSKNIKVYVDVAERLNRRISNHARSTCVDSNSFVGTTIHNPTVNSAVHPSKVG